VKRYLFPLTIHSKFKFFNIDYAKLRQDVYNQTTEISEIKEDTLFVRANVIDLYVLANVRCGLMISIKERIEKYKMLSFEDNLDRVLLDYLLSVSL
jgi:hypothetical protein